jgi:hypothetical protein
MLSQKQRDLLEHVISALDDPKQSPYYGMPIEKAFPLVSAKLKEIKEIDNYDRAMKGIK